jgi:FixJ family two-component response regulator
VLDLQMPEMNGLALQRQLERAGIRLPVVVITGHDEPGTRARCLAAGAAAYLRKPLDGGMLLAAIDAAIDAGRT